MSPICRRTPCSLARRTACEWDVVDRACQLPDLFVGADRQRCDLGKTAALAEPFDLLGQLDLGDVQGTATQTSDRADQGPADGQREDQGGQHRAEDDRGVAQRVGPQRVGAGAQRVIEIGRQLLRHRAVLVDARLHRAGELGGVHGLAERAGVGGAANVGGSAQRRVLIGRGQLVEPIDRRGFRACGVRSRGPQLDRVGETGRGGQHPLGGQRALRREGPTFGACASTAVPPFDRAN
ncbi:hypothetical protein [Mycolicibacterium mageritense]|uniref:hypothetical protein n=1 Tax=Mycolicibacterium mageritense TaxID=53462 RepID=UPI0023F39785|nr:hypothetical protein [Mycolicibacterium mageritense]